MPVRHLRCSLDAQTQNIDQRGHCGALNIDLAATGCCGPHMNCLAVFSHGLGRLRELAAGESGRQQYLRDQSLARRLPGPVDDSFVAVTVTTQSKVD
jgi:hypothetical protein